MWLFFTSTDNCIVYSPFGILIISYCINKGSR